MHTQDHACTHAHFLPHTSHGVAAQKGPNWQRLVGNSSQHDWLYKHFKVPTGLYVFKKCQKFPAQKKSRESSIKGARGRKTLPHIRAHLPHSCFPHTFPPFGTFNGIKLWAWKSDNNCLDLKHYTLTEVTRPFSPPPLALRRGHLLLLLKSLPQWQAIVVRRHFLCHYSLTCGLLLLSYWQTAKISRCLKGI